MNTLHNNMPLLSSEGQLGLYDLQHLQEKCLLQIRTKFVEMGRLDIVLDKLHVEEGAEWQDERPLKLVDMDM